MKHTMNLQNSRRQSYILTNKRHVFGQKFLISTYKIIHKDEQRISLARERIKTKRSRANDIINKNRKIVEFKIGGSVLVKALRTSNSKKNKIDKFSDVYEGPYVIEPKNGHSMYLFKNLGDQSDRGKFHVNNLKPYFGI